MKSQLEYINNLRFPLILGVVADHASVCMPQSVRGDDLASLLFSMLQVVVKISVPVFFIISGMLFFRNTEEFGKDVYLGKLRTRVRTLLVPYILWSLICLLYLCMKQLPAILHTGNTDSISNMFTLQIFWMINNGLPLHSPLWYVRDLILLTVCSPLVWLIISRLRYVGMTVIFVLYMINDIDSRISFPISIFFFSLGAYLSICRIDVSRIAMKMQWWTLALAMVMLCCAVQGNITLARFSQAIIAVGCMLLSAFLTGRYGKTVPRQLTDSVFFVYAAHTIVFVMVCNSILSIFIPDTSILALLFLRLLVVSMAAASLCVMVYTILKRIFPKTIAILTGSR